MTSSEVKTSNPEPPPLSSQVTQITPEAICKVCQCLVDDILNDNVVGNTRWSLEKEGTIWATKHHAHSTPLIRSCRECWLCQIILLEIGIRLPTAYAIKKSAFSRAFVVGTPPGSRLERLLPFTSFMFRETWDQNSLLNLKAPLSHHPSYEPDDISEGEEGPLPNMSWLGKSVSRHATSSICYALATRWLDDCLRSHSLCQDHRGTPRLPTRVLDVGSSQSPPFLYQSGGRTAAYITLSHCWGGNIAESCLSSNLDSYRNEVRFSELPKTFQDTITITRRLGFRYIWIDALCIVQDDCREWEQEAAKMGEYYRNSTLTIAADDAINSSEGFLQPRTTKAVHGAPIGVYAFPDGSRRHLTVTKSNLGSWAGQKLDQRAWTLQERVLSSRILHYTLKGLFWECRTVSWHEAGGSRDPDITFQTLSSKAGHYHDQNDLTWRWEMLVEEYTSRQLSVQADKLPAFSGLAAMYKEVQDQGVQDQGVQDQDGQKYLAGLWYHKMPRCFLWSAMSLRKPSGSARTHRAPSWSWASIDASVHYPHHEEEIVDTVKLLPGFSVAGGDVKESSQGSFGHVTGGYIIVTGTLYPAKYLNKKRHPKGISLGCLETSFPGLREGEWKRCSMDTDDAERDCFLLPCMTSDVDVEKDDIEYILVEEAKFEAAADENDSAGEEDTENTDDQGDGEGTTVNEHILKADHMEGRDRGHSNRSGNEKRKRDDADQEGTQSNDEELHRKRNKQYDSSSEVGDVRRIYMLVLERLPVATKSDEDDDRDNGMKDETQTFRRIGLAYWKVSLPEDWKLPHLERIRIE